jgi:pyruvate,water dikinase
MTAEKAVTGGSYVVSLREIDEAQAGLVGGKAARLGALSRIDGIDVPAGFCVTTLAFRDSLAQAPAVAELIDRLSRVDQSDRDAIRDLSGEVRILIEGLAVPAGVVAAVACALEGWGGVAYAVRSSASAEDLPAASFAGQHDSYLNVERRAILDHIVRCWASLFSERAVTYRLRNGFDHRTVQMAVAVQEMVPADAAGVMFTADPVTGNRTVTSVEGCLGLGEALVAGLVNPDVYKVRDGELLDKAVGEASRQPALSDAQVIDLARLGRRLEAHFGGPQDIEWCIADDAFSILQCRPITTLFPVPASGGEGRRVYVSVGHQQMMTDAMKPLGVSLFQLTAGRAMYEAGGRLFVDVADDLAVERSRTRILDGLGKSDPLIQDALEAVLARGGLGAPAAGAGPGGPPSIPDPTPLDPSSGIVSELVRLNDASIEECGRAIATRSGTALVEFVLDDIDELKRVLFDPRSMQVIMAGMGAAWWMNERLDAWLGEKNAADTLSQSVPGNVTSEMGLALLDVADAVRPHPEVVAFLEDAKDAAFLDRLADLPGGGEAARAIRSFLDRYGMRCPGEIDITRPRWSERPDALVPAILTNVRSFAPGEAGRRFEQGRREAAAKQRDVLERLRALPGGEEKADEAEQAIDRLRAFAGYREYPKYCIVRRYAVYKRALMDEARRLVHAGVLREEQDICYLTLPELLEVVRADLADDDLVEARRRAFSSYRSLTPPRVLTSDGEVFAGDYRREGVPPGAIVGLAASGGVVEGRARVMLDMAHAELEPGDILVTAYTDPSWSPLFLSIRALVTEVGGLMTHGAVIAREYGLPAIVGAEHATELIEDRQMIRVNGAEGYVEVLSGRGHAGPAAEQPPR